MNYIIGISLISLFCALILKQTNPAFSAVLTIAAACLLFCKISDTLAVIISTVNEWSSSSEEIYSYIRIMVKALGIALISQFICDICRDSGENALAGQTELASKIIIIAMILPLFESIIKAVSGLLR